MITADAKLDGARVTLSYKLECDTCGWGMETRNVDPDYAMKRAMEHIEERHSA